MKSSISHVHARRIWDSRGRPTVEVDVTLASGARGRGVAPAGASRGSREAIELRDGGDFLRGRDVAAAIASVRGPIADVLVGKDARDQGACDAALVAADGTAQKSHLGGNAIVAASFAVLHAAAAHEGIPVHRLLSGSTVGRMPMPMVQILGGGAHAGRRVDIQDFLLMPLGAASFEQAMVWTSDVYFAAGDLLDERGPRVGVAEEGGYWPTFERNEDALELLTRAIERAGLRAFEDVGIALDVAASEFGRDGTYTLGLEQRSLGRPAFLELLAGWVNRYPIVSVEDPFAEDDAEGMRAFTARFGDTLQIVGDDYLVTRAEAVRRAADERACNAVLLKANQVGTVTETRAALDAARAAGFGAVVSARSGETEDVTIAHLAVGWDAGQLKVGSFTRSERMAKWNEVLRIEESLGARARYAGLGALPRGVSPRGR